MQVISTITCDLTRKGAPAIVHAMQNDANTRYVRIRMTDNGVPWTAPEGAYAFVAVGKSDGKKAFYRYMADEATEAVTFEGNEATLVLLPDALTAAGLATATINIYTADDEKLSPLYFVLDVQRAPVTDEDVVSSDYYQLPMKAVEEATNAANKAVVDANAAIEETKKAITNTQTAITNAEAATSAANAAAESVKSSTAEGMNVIDEAAEAALADIDAKGDVILAAIPEDFVTLATAYDLTTDVIAGTIQRYTKNNYGEIIGVKHVRGDKVVRLDVYESYADKVIEKRTLATGESLAITTDLITLETHAAYAAG